MKLAILGAGRVGSALGAGLARAGHAVVFAVRDPSDEKHAPLRDIGGVAPIPAAVAAADAVLLAMPWRAVPDALAAAGDLTGKLLIDATNPIGPGFVLTHGHTDSGAEQVARWAPGARVVKAFNSTGAENLAQPRYGERGAVMFVCGDDPTDRETVVSLARALGFDALALGPLSRARWLEPLAMIWISLSGTPGLGRDFAFTVARRDEG